MSAPRPGHVSRRGERRRRPPGSALARPEHSARPAGSLPAPVPSRPLSPPGPVPFPAPVPSRPRFVAPRPSLPPLAGPSSDTFILEPGPQPGPVSPRGSENYPPQRAPRRGEGGAYNSQHAPRRTDYSSQRTPRLRWWCRRYRRAAAALAEGLPQGSGRSAPPPARRPPGGSRRSGGGFKSPVPAPASCRPPGATGEALHHEIEELRQRELALDQEIAQLMSEGYRLEELEEHIALLHEYNDIKDAGQMLLGKLAVIRGVTTKQLYPEYDLELSD
ncbi:DNA repair protein SWI5 homolog [Oxyura jamaicensis]|uniref:DNA repair protein SWI5 homolog n=1 Tax=Oxyura jamaicensis TaxID=8884 RepID=UPI0015A5E500|nr:DNA repair protein SWI5 homolog [Oxyura jamaicensis]